MPTLHLKAQTSRIDRLKNKIAISYSPKEKLQAWLGFCDEWESFNADTLHRYALLARQAAVALKDNYAILLSDYYLSAYLFQKNKLDTALSAINNVITRAKKTTSYNNSLVKFYLLRGNILARTLRYNEVLKQYMEVLPLAEKNNDTIGMIRFSTGIGNVYLRLKNNDEALKWHYKAINLMNTDVLKAAYSFVYINLSVVYYHIATLYDTKQNEDSIEFNLQRAIQYSRQGNSLTNLANSLTMYGSVLAEYKKIKPAIAALTEGLEIRKKIGDIYYLISDMTALAALYENNKDTAKAIATCLNALDIAKQNGSSASSMINVYATLGEVYSTAGNYKKYSEVLLEKLALQDSMYKINNAEAIEEIETKYNVQKKENTILQQRLSIVRKDLIIYGVIGLALLLAAIAALIIKKRKQQHLQGIKEIKIENEKENNLAIEKGKDEERRRIIADLHDDVGSGLSTIRMISDLIAGQTGHTLKLNQYAIKVSGITKQVTERMNTIVWALNTENDTLQNLCEYIREYGFNFFEDSPIKFTSNLLEAADDIQLSGMQRKNIFLIVKECLNNAYKHSGAKNITVNIALEHERLYFRIQDDGKGINIENPFGNGLRNIKKRMVEINGEVAFTFNNGTLIILEVLPGDTIFKMKA